ncbi:ParA family protein [Empedobacter sp. 225-1]|uniref:ParA family protein n=1 Tax=Empedobacter sp. 225-1 TaxID=2746725 RepID=UPI002575CAB6|nr:ParA family protein [Empedobacter sp. 225-1]MDM1523840.1 ParA family protein [Empedobacter sp. 225-1]
MAKVIAIVNHKGGVGKTTTTLNLGYYLAGKGKKILFVDMDAQGNLSEWCDRIITDYSINDVFSEDKTINDVTYPVDGNDKINIVPSGVELSTLDITIGGQVAREYILADALDVVKPKYDFILIDCPPAVTIGTINALTASDYYITVTQANNLALRGAEKVTAVINKMMKKVNPNLKHLGVLVSFFDSRLSLNKSFIETIFEIYGDNVFESKIRNNIAIQESSVAMMSIFDYSPNSNGAKDYEAFGDEVVKRLSKQ